MQETANSGFFFLAPWLVFAPVIGLLINLIFGRRFSENMIGTGRKPGIWRGIYRLGAFGVFSRGGSRRDGALAACRMDPRRHAAISIGPSASTRYPPP